MIDHSVVSTILWYLVIREKYLSSVAGGPTSAYSAILKKEIIRRKYLTIPAHNMSKIPMTHL